MKAHIFREYDIRGTVPDELTREAVQTLGRALGTYYGERGANRISLGRDCRLSSPDLSMWLAEGLMGSGIDIVDLGMVPTPLLYFSLHQVEVDGGVQITGSHNPPEFNGFKVCLGKNSIYGEEIQELRKICDSGAFAKGNGEKVKEGIVGGRGTSLNCSITSVGTGRGDEKLKAEREEWVLGAGRQIAIGDT